MMTVSNLVPYSDLNVLPKAFILHTLEKLYFLNAVASTHVYILNVI